MAERKSRAASTAKATSSTTENPPIKSGTAKASPATAPAAKVPVAKAPVVKAPVAKAAPAKAAPAKAAPARRGIAQAAPATRATSAARRPRPVSAAAGRLVVRADEDPWTPQELAQVRAALDVDLARLAEEIAGAESDIADLLRDTGDGAGEDQADAGSNTFEREHEMSLAANSRDMYDQTARALERIDAGTYGVCEACGSPIGKRRLQAFPRATLCLACKQRQERR